jgi:hypothetical protein
VLNFIQFHCVGHTEGSVLLLPDCSQPVDLIVPYSCALQSAVVSAVLVENHILAFFLVDVLLHLSQAIARHL